MVTVESNHLSGCPQGRMTVTKTFKNIWDTFESPKLNHLININLYLRGQILIAGKSYPVDSSRKDIFRKFLSVSRTDADNLTGKQPNDIHFFLLSKNISGLPDQRQENSRPYFHLKL